MRAEQVSSAEVGYFRVYAKPPGGTRREITMFRDAPVTVGTIATADPFTDISLSLQLPQVTVFDRPGVGDLEWLVPYADIDVVWESTGALQFDWQWEGYIASESFEMSGASSAYTLECKGSALLLDNYFAQPQFPSQPIPYELLIKDAFDLVKHPAHLARMKMVFPADWDTVVPPFDDPAFYGFLKPWGVRVGQLWTGLTSRMTGSWDPVLTGYVQGLLSVMYDVGGSQWTIRMEKGRKPVLYLRTVPEPDDPDILVVDLLNPGVAISASRDFSQSANVIYGDGTDTAGTTYSGMEVTPDGSSTYFVPFASSASVYPTKGNPAYNANIARKEAHIKFPSAMDQVDATRVARAQHQRFADPGITGTVTLTTDLVLNDGRLFPSRLVKAGRTVKLVGFRGGDVLAHITQASVEPGGSATLTIDSKYRDQLTVSQVQARTRDALTPLRSLQVGKYSNTVQDLLFPWSYAEGSGMLPGVGEGDAKKFFSDLLPAGAVFPYEKFTRMYPPSNPAYRKYYVKVEKTNHDNATQNWAGETTLSVDQSPAAMYRELFGVNGPDPGVDAHVKVFFSDDQPGDQASSKRDVWVDTSKGGIIKVCTGTSGGWAAGFPNTWERRNNATLQLILRWLPVNLRNETILMSLLSDAPASASVHDIWIKRGPEGTVNVRELMDVGFGQTLEVWTAHHVPPPSVNPKAAIPVRMSAAGSIRLSQVAAYDSDGNVKPVRFHVSVYSNTARNTDMPYMDTDPDSGKLPDYLHPPGGDKYKAGQYFPFFKNAFESVNPNGTDTQLGSTLDGGAGLVVGWGNYFEPAGYWPGRQGKGASRTGLLVDETAWSYDLVQAQQISTTDRHDNLRSSDRGLLYVMIYCDDSDTPTFFQGRFFRQEPGAS